jgi:hypothetical protein
LQLADAYPVILLLLCRLGLCQLLEPLSPAVRVAGRQRLDVTAATVGLLLLLLPWATWRRRLMKLLGLPLLLAGCWALELLQFCCCVAAVLQLSVLLLLTICST